MNRRALLTLGSALLLGACAPARGERSPAQPAASPTASPPPPTATVSLSPPVARRTPVIAPLFLPPKRLRIPRIGVDARVQEVGLDAAGEMVLPTNGEYVVWYEGSAPPGLPGNSVFAGHVDWGGRLAVFARLRELTPGDEIETIASDGASHRFRVREVWTVEPATAPLAQIFGPTARPTVTLITCGGMFDYRTRDYSLRVIVRAEAGESADSSADRGAGSRR
ncbi:MAG: class F sortase [Chloroflexota bacterium]|nr:class F sortase [Dehalococcoidia bacterium]MDW8252688.1 class F sortase [Chloroflexota bacterium]